MDLNVPNAEKSKPRDTMGTRGVSCKAHVGRYLAVPACR